MLSVVVVVNLVVLIIVGFVLLKLVGVGSDMVFGWDISLMMSGDVFGLFDIVVLNKVVDQKIFVSMLVCGCLVMNDSGILDVQLVKINIVGVVKVVCVVLDKEIGYWGYIFFVVVDVLV